MAAAELTAGFSVGLDGGVPGAAGGSDAFLRRGAAAALPAAFIGGFVSSPSEEAGSGLLAAAAGGGLEFPGRRVSSAAGRVQYAGGLHVLALQIM